MVNKDSR